MFNFVSAFAASAKIFGITMVARTTSFLSRFKILIYDSEAWLVTRALHEIRGERRLLPCVLSFTSVVVCVLETYNSSIIFAWREEKHCFGWAGVRCVLAMLNDLILSPLLSFARFLARLELVKKKKDNVSDWFILG